VLLVVWKPGIAIKLEYLSLSHWGPRQDSVW